MKLNGTGLYGIIVLVFVVVSIYFLNNSFSAIQFTTETKGSTVGCLVGYMEGGSIENSQGNCNIETGDVTTVIRIDKSTSFQLTLSIVLTVLSVSLAINFLIKYSKKLNLYKKI